MEGKSTGKSISFEGRSLDEMIPYLGRGFNETDFNELAAAYVQMLEITFHEASTPSEDRALAAAWATVLESLIVLTLVGHKQLLGPFMDARNASKRNAENYGYGSIGWTAIHDPDGLINRIWPDDEALQHAGRASVQDRRAFLLSVAFGREVDAYSGAS